MANDADAEARVRARLRQLRFERGWTLAQVAQRAGMATSTLSRLESGARGLALVHLIRLAGALGVEPGALLGASRPADPAPARDGKVWWPLTDERPDDVRAYKVRLPRELREPSLGSHEGHVLLVVLSGRLRLVTAEGDTVLRPGDAQAFSTWIPHWIGVVDEPVDVLAVLRPSGVPVRIREPPVSS